MYDDCVSIIIVEYLLLDVYVFYYVFYFLCINKILALIIWSIPLIIGKEQLFKRYQNDEMTSSTFKQLVYHKELLYRCWLGFYRKKIVPLLLRIFEIFFKLTMDFQSNLVQSPWKSMFFFLNFWWTPCNCNDFYSTLWNFLLISSTGFFFSEKAHSIELEIGKKIYHKIVTRLL